MHFVISGSSGPSGSPWSILFPYFYHISWAIAQRFQVFSCVWERSSVGCSGCTVQSAKMSNSWQNICLASFSQITSSLGFRCLPSAWRHMVTNSSASREADSMAFGHSSMSNLSFYALCGLNSSRTSSSLWLVFIFFPHFVSYSSRNFDVFLGGVGAGGGLGTMSYVLEAQFKQLRCH